MGQVDQRKTDQMTAEKKVNELNRIFMYQCLAHSILVKTAWTMQVLLDRQSHGIVIALERNNPVVVCHFGTILPKLLEQYLFQKTI